MQIIVRTDNVEELLQAITAEETPLRLNEIHDQLSIKRPIPLKSPQVCWMFNSNDGYFKFVDWPDLKLHPEVKNASLNLRVDNPNLFDEGAEIQGDVTRYFEDFVLFLLRDHGATIKSVFIDLEPDSAQQMV